MMETCIHCGESTNTHRCTSRTCVCGRPINIKITVLAQVDPEISYTTCEQAAGCMYAFERALVIAGDLMKVAQKVCYIDKAGYIYIMSSDKALKKDIK